MSTLLELVTTLATSNHFSLSRHALDVLEDPMNQVELPELEPWQEDVIRRSLGPLRREQERHVPVTSILARALHLVGFATVLPGLRLSAVNRQYLQEGPGDRLGGALHWPGSTWTISPGLFDSWVTFLRLGRSRTPWEHELYDACLDLDLWLLDSLTWADGSDYLRLIHREITGSDVITEDSCAQVEAVLTGAGLNEIREAVYDLDLFVMGRVIGESVKDGATAVALLPVVAHVTRRRANPVAIANAVRAMAAEPHLPAEWVIAAEDWDR